MIISSNSAKAFLLSTLSVKSIVNKFIESKTTLFAPLSTITSLISLIISFTFALVFSCLSSAINALQSLAEFNGALLPEEAFFAAALGDAFGAEA